MLKIRIDKWLWYTRTAKSRSLAQKLVKSGKVRINTNRISSPSRIIEPGDVLTVTLERQIKVLKMVAPGERRGPVPEARLLYEDLSPPTVKTEPVIKSTKQAVREEGTGRPTKKERRELDRFRQSRDEA
ncbi:MAG: RNA-binding S4 domain-containing protein [Rhizobiaceae bacterium]